MKVPLASAISKARAKRKQGKAEIQAILNQAAGEDSPYIMARPWYDQPQPVTQPVPSSQMMGYDTTKYRSAPPPPPPVEAQPEKAQEREKEPKSSKNTKLAKYIDKSVNGSSEVNKLRDMIENLKSIDRKWYALLGAGTAGILMLLVLLMVMIKNKNPDEKKVLLLNDSEYKEIL